MQENPIIDLMRERKIANNKQQFDDAKKALFGLESTIYQLIDATYASRAPISEITNALRQCDDALQDKVRALRCRKVAAIAT